MAAGDAREQGTTSMIPSRGRRQATAGGGGGTVASTGGQRFKTTVEALGDPWYVTRYGMPEYLDRSHELYRDKDRDRFKGYVTDTGMGERDAARTREQQLGNYAYNEWNLAQNNPRGNLNGMSYPRTLRYSRLADMLNNQFHYRPGHQQLIGTGKKGIMQQGDTATISRWDPIETEEMRQMKANRDLDMRSRQAGVDLQSRLQAYPQELQEAVDKATLQMSEYISQRDVDFINSALQTMINTEYGGQWRTYFQEVWQDYLENLKLQVNSKIYAAAQDLEPLAQSLFIAIYKGSITTASLAQKWQQQIMLDAYASEYQKAKAQGYSDAEANEIATRAAFAANGFCQYLSQDVKHSIENIKSGGGGEVRADIRPKPKREGRREAALRARAGVGR